MLGITKFFNKNIAPLASLEEIKPVSYSGLTRCNVCNARKKSGELKAYMVNGFIKYKCAEHYAEEDALADWKFKELTIQ